MTLIELTDEELYLMYRRVKEQLFPYTYGGPKAPGSESISVQLMQLRTELLQEIRRRRSIQKQVSDN